MALTLEIFCFADGYQYLVDSENKDSAWLAFIEPLYQDICNGRYPRTQHSFSTPLSKVQRYLLKKAGIPDIFWKEDWYESYADISNDQVAIC